MIVLASESPRRKELMALITKEFRVCAPQVEEDLPAGVSARQAVELLATRKAQAVARRAPGSIVIGADTVVVLEGEILGKPQDEAHARQMLTRLSGCAHDVLTGVAVISRQGSSEVFSCATRVRFLPMSGEEIDAYVFTGEPMDKAGAYGIQGGAARFIERIDGDYFNVMGLPVSRLYQHLKRIAPDFFRPKNAR